MKCIEEIWVYIEITECKISPVSLELCCEARKLCDECGRMLTVVLTEPLSDENTAILENCGVDKIMAVKSDCSVNTAEVLSAALLKLCEESVPYALLFGATDLGINTAPYFAAEIETGCTSDAVEIVYDSDNDILEFIEPAAGGKIMAVITIPQHRPQVATIRKGTFEYRPTGKRECSIFQMDVVIPAEAVKTEVIKIKKAIADERIAEAEKIICLGNGLKSRSVLKKYEYLAELLGAEIACTRPLVDRGVFDHSRQIGQSGISVRPKLYICFGVSGALNHIMGIHGECTIAVNDDSTAPIFSFCDYGFVGDMDETCQQMIDIIEKRNSK